MATTSGAPALAGTRLRCVAGTSRSRRAAGDRLRSVVGQLTSFVWGEQLPALPGSGASTWSAPSTFADADRELAGLTGPVAPGAHPAPTPPGDKRSAVAHYRALAEQVARERRSGTAHAVWGTSRDA